MHKTQTRARFIIASNKWGTKALSKAEVFKLILKQIQSFHETSHFSSDYKEIWVIENCKLIIDRLDHINTKQNAELTSTFDFCTLCTKLPDKGLLQVLCDLINFGFNGCLKKIMILPQKNAFWSNKLKTKSISSKSPLKRTMHFF